MHWLSWHVSPVAHWSLLTQRTHVPFALQTPVEQGARRPARKHVNVLVSHELQSPQSPTPSHWGVVQVPFAVHTCPKVQLPR